MRLGTLFSDGAVLQQGKNFPVWGETLPGLLIKAEIAGRYAVARSSRSGDFRICLPGLPAGGPYELKVYALENETESITVHDVLIGEVWLCSGQSNMEYRLGTDWRDAKKKETVPFPLTRKQEQEFIEKYADGKNFRFITVPMEVTGCEEKYFHGSWKDITPENAPAVSAVSAWFGAALRSELNVPVGLICCSWGGSVVETWTSPAALRSNPDTKKMIDEWEMVRGKKESWDKPVDWMMALRRPDPGNQGFGRGWADPEFDDSAWRLLRIPGSWIKQNIAGNGAVWVRKCVQIPPELAGKELVLHTGGIDKHDIAYFNNVEIGRTGKDFEIEYFDAPREYHIPGKLVKAGRNVIAIRAFSFFYDGAFLGCNADYRLSTPGQDIPLDGEWKAQAEIDWGRFIIKPPSGVNNHNTPGLQYGSMIVPLLPYALGGVIWYQGESNGNSIEESLQYQRKMETLIRDWRFRFDQPELPFIQVQLAEYWAARDYDPKSTWAVLRDSQRRVCQTLPQVYLATALDTGEADDIHPQDKETVGRRLASAALYWVYHRKRLPCGPDFRKAEPENGALRLFFHFTEGMELRGEPCRSFYLAGDDGHYFPADHAEIDGDSILLSSEHVRNPVSVRYAWSNNPVSILYNRQYPAASFCSSNQQNCGKKLNEKEAVYAE